MENAFLKKAKALKKYLIDIVIGNKPEQNKPSLQCLFRLLLLFQLWNIRVEFVSPNFSYPVGLVASEARTESCCACVWWGLLRFKCNWSWLEAWWPHPCQRPGAAPDRASRTAELPHTLGFVVGMEKEVFLFFKTYALGIASYHPWSQPWQTLPLGQHAGLWKWSWAAMGVM